ncbi:hypothetical protein WCU81_02300 [Pectobacterium atrosepticum]|uniref:hypothetical protein n=1 Tax=Pectobacterium atrosepticum TaxID=29471 RepID=UPI000399D7DD|nr:hypothetical protein [Pectobacterium atrosepticum]GKV85108.1 hypothetical protein PEC301296_14200 [Pectobacterium carotovorum subsp. carotovorum]AIA71367.1 hypothetical protein EV46_12395 [Pectobacterium atrosepticum]AIK13813.1 hypothetical protein GZ59_19980 [Pectobacterium atrosepticum]ATY90651.1 hypothetical protein CVS35_09935 [Pectobacterium atrosepticum]KFX16127.1 hypothetical protein JV34_04870 [Pectobacterium atrosepticum]
MGQLTRFAPVPAGLCCKGIGYGATQSQVISGAVTATSSHRDSGDPCIHSLIFSTFEYDFSAFADNNAASAVINGGVRHVA